MKDNDLLVTELYKDPSGNRITALSVYLTQKASQFVFTITLLVIMYICTDALISIQSYRFTFL